VSVKCKPDVSKYKDQELWKKVENSKNKETREHGDVSMLHELHNLRLSRR
jgi:hypothetical protein